MEVTKALEILKKNFVKPNILKRQGDLLQFDVAMTVVDTAIKSGKLSVEDFDKAIGYEMPEVKKEEKRKKK